MSIPCSFLFTPNQNVPIYGCSVMGKKIPEDRMLKFIGQHLDGKTNNDVLSINFQDCTVTKVPQGLTKIFPNFKILEITNTKLKKISKSDLVEYNSLVGLCCTRNELEYLPGDLFEGFESLVEINFYGNQLKVIEPNILDRLGNLKVVSFGNNPNYDFGFLIDPEDNNALMEAKLELNEKFFGRFKFLEDLRESEEKLKQQVEQLVDSELKLTQQYQQLRTELENEKLKHSESIKFQVSLTTDLKNFIQDESTKDFKIIIDDREFPVHKFLLAARSPTLSEILRNNPVVDNLNLVDISVEIFEKILKFLYTDDLPREDGTNFLHLFDGAGRLKIEELKKYAAEKLIDQIDDENAVEVLNLGNKYENLQLKKRAYSRIKRKYPVLKFKEEWATDPNKVKQIVDNFNQKESKKRKLKEEIQMLDDEFEETMNQ